MKLLAVSLAFPPLAYPRSIQVARLLKHTNADIALFCADEPEARIDNTIEPDAEASLAYCERVRVKRSTPARVWDRATRKFARSLWNSRNLAPDQYARWRADVGHSIARYLGQKAFVPDAVITFAQPFSDHLIGLDLKKKLGLPWLAHFSDPWADNPFAGFDEPTRQKNLELEGKVARSADLLVFTSEETIDLFSSKYSPEIRAKARVLPQCYSSDPRPGGDSSESGSSSVIIRYLGNFYGNRTPRPLIAALQVILKSQPEILTDVRFELVGLGDSDEVFRLANSLPDGLIIVRSSVDYVKSLELMQRADGLLMIDAPAEVSVFLPSKLIDYIGSRRPIFGITPRGTAASLIKKMGGSVGDPGDPASTASLLAGFINDLKKKRAIGHISDWGSSEVRSLYSAETVALRFRSMLDEMLSAASLKSVINGDIDVDRGS